MSYFNNFSIKLKLNAMLVVFLLGTIFLIANAITDAKKELVEEKTENLEHIVKMAENESKRLANLAKSGEISMDEARALFVRSLKGFSDDTLYYYAYDLKGNLVANRTKSDEYIGKNYIDLKDPNGVYIIKGFIDKALAGDKTPLIYEWKKTGTNELAEKTSISTYIKDFGLVIGAGVFLDDVDAEFEDETRNAIINTIVMLIIMSFIMYTVTSAVATPARHIVKVMDNMSQHNFNDDIDIARRDEIGQIYVALEKFKDDLRKSVELEKEQQILKQQQLEQAAFVGDATKSVSDKVFEIEEHFSGISSAVLQLSGSLENVAYKVDNTSNLTRLAEAEAEKGTATINSLNKISEDIGDVIRLIQAIAEKTNLLALNASIEAARAGDDGRGFAVVAEEVKKLASQTSEATNSIADQIKQIQDGSSNSVNAIENIAKQIVSINGFAQELVVSISEQKEATNDISVRMEHASTGSKFVAEKMKEIVEKV